jgi:hypothetical protein
MMFPIDKLLDLDREMGKGGWAIVQMGEPDRNLVGSLSDRPSQRSYPSAAQEVELSKIQVTLSRSMEMESEIEPEHCYRRL